MTPEELFAPYSPEVRAIAERACALILSVYPDAVEQVDGPDHLIAYGRGLGMNEQLWYVAPFKAHVNMGFMRGTEQDDPSGLLEGTGKRLRHVKLRSLDDVDRPALLALLRSSLELAR
jgi:hypothetical protein